MFKEVVLPAGAAYDTASGCGRGSGWARLYVNRVDPVKMTLAADLQKSVLAHTTVSSCGKYTRQFHMFAAWCEALAEPRASLPASDATVTLYLQSVINGAKTFAPVKAASATIAFYQKNILFSHEPMRSLVACMMRSAATQRFGPNEKIRKEPFEWGQVVNFAEACGVRHQGYCHMVVVTMALVMFGGVCRYDDAPGLIWSNIRFESDGGGLEIMFGKRKNAKFRQGNKVIVASSPLAAVCLVWLLREL
jgi:hypothetical protein